MPGKRFEKSVKKKDTYEELRKKGEPKSKAAAIANKQAKGGAKEMGKKAAATTKGERKPSKPAPKKK